MTPYIIKFSINDESIADEIIETLLHHKLAVCCQKSPIKSKYVWEGEVTGGDEILVTIKTFECKLQRIERIVNDMHTYDTFEFVGHKMEYVNDQYLKYMKSVIKE